MHSRALAPPTAPPLTLSHHESPFAFGQADTLAAFAKLATQPRHRPEFHVLVWATTRFAKAYLRGLKMRSPNVEHFLERIGVIVGQGGIGQFVHVDVNAPEEFALGVMNESPLTRVAKIGNTMHALQTAREQLELPEGFCIRCNSPHLHSVTCYSRGVFHAQDTQSPLLSGLPYCHRLGNNGSVPNEEVARYYAARLLVSPRSVIEAAMQLPFSTYHETYIPESQTYTSVRDPPTAWNATGKAGSLIMLGGGIPHAGPPLPHDASVTRIFILARVALMANPYMAYSQMRACEVELFHACYHASVKNMDASAKVYALWMVRMDEYENEFMRMKVQFESSPMFAVAEALVSYLHSIPTESMRATAADAILGVLIKAHTKGASMKNGKHPDHSWTFHSHEAYTTISRMVAAAKKPKPCLLAAPAAKKPKK